MRFSIALLLLGCDVTAASTALALPLPSCSDPWRVHVINDLAKGSDGLTLADFDGDGFTDVGAVWEADSKLTVHFHPGFGGQRLIEQWPAVTAIPFLPAGEGVLSADMDGDGMPDLIGFPQAENTPEAGIQIAFNRDLGSRWSPITLPGSATSKRWLTGVIADFDGDGDPDVLGGPATAQVYLYSHPGYADATNAGLWTETYAFHARHVMRLFADDVDGDGDLDAVVAQRSTHDAVNSPIGFWWAENGASWQRHMIGPAGRIPMIACDADLDGDGDVDYVVPEMSPGRLSWWERTADPDVWTEHPIPLAAELTSPQRDLKGCEVADLDADGFLDIVVTSAASTHNVWLVRGPLYDTWQPLDAPNWETKLEEPLVYDVDGSAFDGGDLDVLISGEQRATGVTWLANPLRPGCVQGSYMQ